MIFAVFGALAVGLSLGIFGSGGSILTVPALVYLLGHDEKTAIAESLAIVGSIACIGALPYARAKLVDWRTVALFGLPGMAGTYLGAWASAWVSGSAQLVVFAGVMLVAALNMWKRKKAQGDPEMDRIRRRPVARVLLEGLAVGALTGFVGVGGGFLIVPALVLLGGLTMQRAVATSLVIIALKSVVGFWKYLEVLSDTSAAMDWSTIGMFVGLGATGSFAGKALGSRIPQRALQRGFAIFLLVMAVFIALNQGQQLLDPDPPPSR